MTDANTMDEMEPRVEDTATENTNEQAAAARVDDVTSGTQFSETTADNVHEVTPMDVVSEESITAEAVADTVAQASDEISGAEALPAAMDDDDDEEEDIPHLARISFDEEDAAPNAPAGGGEEDLMEPAEDPEIPLELIDHDALWVVRRLRAKGYEAYLTGGCVRDLLLGRQPKDFDVATAAHPEQVRKVFRNCRLIGRRFRLAHVYFPNGKVIETATFRANPLETQEDLPDDLLVERDNVFGTVEEDARRRDLTINGLFYDPLAGKVLDFVDGRRDLEARLIRTIGDPDIRFQEDPVRILRAIKFATRLDFDFETQTLAAMRAHVADLARCAAPRLLEELHRLLTSGKAANAFRLCEEVGVLDVLVPELTQALNGELDLVRYAYGQVKHDDIDAEETSDEEISDVGDDESLAQVDDESAEVLIDADETPEPVAFEAPAEVVPDTESPAADTDTTVADVSVGAFEHEGGAPSPEDDAQALGENNMPAAPVLLTPEERHARYTSLLTSLDAVHAREAELSSAVSFAAVLLSGFESYRSAGADAVAWLDDVTGTWTERIRLTRHDRETIRYLCRAMAQLDPSLRRGAKARHLVGRPWFREALLLHTLSLHAAGQSLEEIARWKVVAAHYQKPFKQPKKGERQPRPRRMRRSRRGGGDNRRGRRR